MNKKIRAKLDAWVAAGLISPAQAKAISVHESGQKSGPSWGLLIFAGFGAVVLGLGVILLFAYNWAEMHKFAKLGAIFGALAVAHGAGLWMRQKDFPTGAIEAAHLLGTMLFGAGIWLVAQIYHISAHYPNAFLVWAVGALLLTWTLPSVPQGVLAAVLLSIWACAETISYGTSLTIAPLVVLVGLGLPAWRLRSPVLLTAAAIAFMLSAVAMLAVNERILFLALLTMSVFFIVLAWLAQSYTTLPQATTVFRRLAFLLYLPLIFVLSYHDVAKDLFPDFWDGASFLEGYLLVALVITFALSAWAVRQAVLSGAVRTFEFRTYLFAPVAVLVLFTLLCLLENSVSYVHVLASGLGSLAFVHHTLSEMWEGCRQTRLKLVVSGSFLLALWVFARFTDLFDSLLARGAAFLVLGAALFFIAAIYHRQKQRRPVEGRAS